MPDTFLHELLHWVAAHPHWMGLVIFLTALGESLALVGMLVPGAVLMFGFGALVALGHLEFWPACAWAVAGAVAGDGLSFWLGKAYHQRLRCLWPFSRHPQALARAEVFFYRHGGKSVLFGRFFGPVRAVIPAVAGMLDMPVGRFFVVNVLSALLWAPAYLLPGMVFAASLELAAQVAWRLVVLALLAIALVWLTVVLVRRLFGLLHPRVHGWVLAFARWSRDKPLLRPVSVSLLDPNENEVRGLATLGVLLLCIGLLGKLLLDAAGQELPTALDRGVYRFLQDLRTPWADQVMVLITELGDSEVKLTLAAVVFAWLLWRRARSAAWHWLAALGFGVLTTSLFKWLFQVQRPFEAGYQGWLGSWSFPSNHATMGTILFGFLAVLIARETPPNRRWIPYLAAALVYLPIAFSRLYLGVHWLTDTLAGIALGLAWVSLVGLAYNQRPSRAVGRRSLVLAALAAVALSLPPHAWLHHADDLRRYQPAQPSLVLERSRWLAGAGDLPAWRLDWRGRHQQPLLLQWAAPAPRVRATLAGAGWQPAPTLSAAALLAWLNPRVELAELPVLPRVHAGRHEAFSLVLPTGIPDSRWVLRFWDSGYRLENGDPVWLAGLDRERLERRLGMITVPLDSPAALLPESLRSALAPALATGRARLVGGGNPPVVP